MRNGLGQSIFDQIIAEFTGQSSLYIDSMNLSEWHIYGSSRIGIYQTNINLVYRNVRVVQGATTDSTSAFLANNNYALFILERGAKRYELTNHLGNVLAVVSDKKIQVCTNTIISYYIADLVSATDYSPFGAPLAGRTYTAPNISYRFSFNGKENDNEVKGTGNQQDYGMRIYDNRLGKFLSVDPLTQEYPFYSPYHFAGNSPIRFIDLDGEEPIDPMIYFWALKAIYAFDNWKKESSDMSDGLARGYMAQTGSSNLAFDYSKKYTNGDALAWGMAQMGQSMGAYMSMKSGLKQMNPKPQETNKPNSQEVNKPKIEPVKVQNVKVQETTIPQNRIPAQRVNHVFSDKPGKLNNTTENKSLIETIANNDKNLLGTDKFGLRWYAETRKDNSQIYVSVNKSGEITGAGINTFARPFSAEKGLRIKPERE